jgi:molybdate transport system substrate-binding protein
MRTLTILLLMIPLAARPAEAIVAVAANFAPMLEELGAQFESSSPHSLRISSGSTGKLYAQIVNGAPFDLFLAADAERPRLLEASGYGVAGSRFTYATGRLVAWSADADLIGNDLASTLGQDRVRRLAIANPALAPYGAAAREVMDAMGIADTFEGRLVMGENVTQAFTLAATRNADIGLVALSTVLSLRGKRPGSYLAISPALHEPIRQDALLLVHGRDNEAALAFIRFLKTDKARAKIAASGYGTE